jgi:hypothetical protein
LLDVRLRLLKYIKKDMYRVYAAGIIAFAIGLRFLLVLLHWPMTNSDEGVMKIMAYNIAYNGQHPLVFYGQKYMGVIEAYLGAFFFLITGGATYTALRMGVLLLITFFFIFMYLLTSLIFSKKLALVTIALLSVGSIPYLTRQTIATGGSPETLCFGSLDFLLASWLCLSYRRDAPVRRHLFRLAVYGLFGLVAGLAMWSDMVVLPFLVMATLLIIVFCWRELLLWGGVVIGLIGGALGLLPALWSGLQTGTNPFLILYGLVSGGPSSKLSISMLHNITETIRVSIPTATGLPFCPVIEYPFLGDNTPRSLHCDVIQYSWGLGYLALVGIALIVTLFLLQRYLRMRRTLTAEEGYRTLVRLIAQLFLLGGIVLVVAAFIDSTAPYNQPGYHARYLISVLIAFPAVIAPIWNAASQLKPQQVWARLRTYGGRAILIITAAVLISGTVITFVELPKAQAANNQRLDLIAQLESMGVTRFYTDYWTCYSLIAASNLKLICGVENAYLKPSHNRYNEFRIITDATPNTSWICPQDPDLTMPEYYCLPTLEKMMQNQPAGKWRRYDIDGYVLYRNMRKTP